MALQLFGRAAVSYSVASWSGLLDRHTSQWDQALLDFLGLPLDLFSSLVDVDVPWRGLSPTFAGRWPALRAVPWFPAIGDGAAANVGSGCVDPRQVCVTIGTTSAVRATLAAPVEHVPRGLWCYRVDGRRPLLGGALSEGGNVYAWLKAILRLGADETLEAALRAMPPDSHGLTFLPVLAGERSPGWEGSMRGTLHGLTLATTPLDVLRAGLEGVACRLGLIYQLLRPALPAEPTVIASGGALARSGVWAQMIADMLGKPLTLVPDEGASARGAAVLALEALGLRSDLGRTASAAGETFRPDAARHAIYAQAQQRQQALYAFFAPAR
jgi:gluconokinase